MGGVDTTIAIAGIGLYVLAFLALATAGVLGLVPVVVFFAAVVVLTFGENLITIPQATLPSNLAPREEVGSYNGAFAMVGGAGFIVAVLLGGVVLPTTSNPLLIWVYLVARGSGGHPPARRGQTSPTINRPSLKEWGCLTL